MNKVNEQLIIFDNMHFHRWSKAQIQTSCNKPFRNAENASVKFRCTAQPIQGSIFQTKWKCNKMRYVLIRNIPTWKWKVETGCPNVHLLLTRAFYALWCIFLELLLAYWLVDQRKLLKNSNVKHACFNGVCKCV